MPTTTDAQLVAEYLAGDTLFDTAAAMSRDRHDAADMTQDVFVIAAERMAQLREPDRLKPWLFAILRNEVYRRTGKKRKIVATDFTEPVAEMSLPSQPADEASALEHEELAQLVRSAALGLDERDQLVMEYSVRRGLEGDDLAAALGVSPQQCYGLVHRMRQRTERSIGAFCVARNGRKDCAELAEILSGWDGEFSVLIRKRVARHIDDCATCDRSRRKFVPLAMFGAAPAFAAPAGLRDRILAAAGSGGAEPSYAFDAPGGFPSAIKYARRVAMWLTVSVIALIIAAGTTVFVLADGGETISSAATTTTTTGAAAVGEPSIADEPPGAAGPIGSDTTTTTSGSTSTSTSTSTTDAAAEPPLTTIDDTTTVPTTAPPTTAPPTTAPISPGSLSVSAGTIDFGTTMDAATVMLTNTGGQPVDWSSSTGPSAFGDFPTPFFYGPVSGTLAPGTSVKIDILLDRTFPTEGPLSVTTGEVVPGAMGLLVR
jgi:RNA polymerase sigma factor (sigma-70 family)